MTKPLEAFAQEMRRRRKQRNLSQEALAEKAGISMALVSELERGIATPTLQTMEKIASYFQTTVSEMISSADNHDIIFKIKIKLISQIINLDRTSLEKISSFISKLLKHNN